MSKQAASEVYAPVLKQIFDLHADEAILEEQLRKVLGPVLERIEAGAFDKSRARLSVAKATAAIAAGLSLTLIPLLYDAQPVRVGETVTLRDAEVPLSVWTRGAVSGRVYLPDGGVGGVVLSLTDAESGKTVATSVSDTQGKYALTDLPDGEYRLEAVLPEGMRFAEGTLRDGWILIGSESKISIGKNGTRELTGVDIALWR